MSLRATALMAISLVARLPQAMLGIALMVHGESLTGSLAVGGLMAGGFAAGLGCGGPWWGRQADRRGSSGPLALAAGLHALAVATTAALPGAAPSWWLVAGSVGIGLTMPPFGACVRAALPRLLGSGKALDRAYAAEASALELTFILGPVLALGVTVASSSTLVLIGCAALTVAAAATYLHQAGDVSAPAAGPVPSGWSALIGGLRNRWLVLLVVVMGLVGVVFGATEVGVVALSGTSAGSLADAGLLLGVWGLGSLVAGSLITWRGPAPSPRLLVLQISCFALAHLALAPAAGHPTVFPVALAVAGATIAPLFATVHAITGRVVRACRATEAFSWIATATACGSALGSSVGGVLLGAA